MSYELWALVLQPSFIDFLVSHRKHRKRLLHSRWPPGWLLFQPQMTRITQIVASRDALARRLAAYKHLSELLKRSSTLKSTTDSWTPKTCSTPVGAKVNYELWNVFAAQRGLRQLWALVHQQSTINFLFSHRDLTTFRLVLYLFLHAEA